MPLLLTRLSIDTRCFHYAAFFFRQPPIDDFPLRHCFADAAARFYYDIFITLMLR